MGRPGATIARRWQNGRREWASGAATLGGGRASTGSTVRHVSRHGQPRAWGLGPMTGRRVDECGYGCDRTGYWHSNFDSPARLCAKSQPTFPPSMAPRNTATPDPYPPATPSRQTLRGSRNTWLNGTGSWRSKAPALVATATDSIGVRSGATSELTDQQAATPGDDSPKRFLTKRKSSKGSIIAASLTQVSVSTGGMVDQTPKPDTTKPDTTRIDEPPLPPLPPEPAPSTAQLAPTASTWAWRSWWSRPDGHPDAAKLGWDEHDNVETAQHTPLPGPTPSEEPDMVTKSLGSTTICPQTHDSNTKDPPAGTVPQQARDAADSAPARVTSGGSWFRLWSSAQNSRASHVPRTKLNQVSETAPEVSDEPHATNTVGDSKTPTNVTTDSVLAEAITNSAVTEATSDPTLNKSSTNSPSASGTPKSSAWAFWYRGASGDDAKSAQCGPQKHVGQVAVMDTPSQSKPEAAQFNEQQRLEDEIPTEPLPPKVESLAKRSFASLRGRRKAQNTTKDPTQDLKSTPKSSETNAQTNASPVPEPSRSEPAVVAQPVPKPVANRKSKPGDLVLPQFRSTYRMAQQPSFWKQVRRYFLGGEPASPHLHINPAPPRIKKAVAIGVHGFFPAPIIQKVIGQPTGTSIRFANAAAAAIKDWSEAHGYMPEIEQIALEGEGFVAERVNSLWKLLLNWIDHIKTADFILVACHSQGVPVAMMLVAKLIQFGCVNAARIGVCAMAGINMGPFIEYKTKYLGPTAAELFEFSNPKSLVSQMYLAALDEVLRFGVRILYVGSIDDQLVSLEVSHETRSQQSDNPI